MSSSFFGVNVALQGLYTAQGSLNTTAHNISNATTTGFSRQVATQKATRPMAGVGSVGMIGTGVEITGIEQQRNPYYDSKYWNNNQYLGEYNVKQTQLDQLTYLFNETSDVGLSKEISNLYTQLQKLSTNPSDPSYRAAAISSLDSFTENFNRLSEQLNNLQKEANFGVMTSVEQINSIADQVAGINQQIINQELTGQKANDLRDERNNLIDKLSSIIPIKVIEVDEGMDLKRTTIILNGQTLVDGNKARYLECVPRTQLHNPEDVPDLYDIKWVTGQNFYTDDLTLSGELKGYLDIRDGNNNDNLRKYVSSYTSTLPGATITIENPQRTDIPASGQITVDGIDVNYTSFTYTPEDTTTLPVTPSSITFTIDDTTPAPATPTYIEMGENMEFKGIAHYKRRLNEFVRTFAKEMNDIHIQGQNLYGDSNVLLFTFKGYTGTPPLNDEFSYNQIDISNFRINSEILTDVNKLATTSDVVNTIDGTEILQQLLNKRHDMSMFKQGKPENFFQSIVAEMAIDSKQAIDFQKGQKSIVSSIEYMRQSIMGVDANEETTNMVKFQQAYKLAAKIMSVMDEIFDVTINRLGA
jgi:flagellar hook-associated protein 1 FlgK